MRTQRHQVRRQIIDVTVPDRDLGIRLHEELSGIQCRGLETLIDRCCTEMSTPDRVHRLGRVEVDLGRLSLDNLEQELLEKLYPLLRDALAENIREEDVLSAMLGEDPATSARIELVSLFCRTGTLPFWADVSRPNVVDEAVEVLLMRNSSALAKLVRELSREKRALERLVRQVAAERLRALFEVLVDAPTPAPLERAGETWEMLVMARGASLPAPMIWIAALQTVCRGENRGQEPVAFFREVLGRTALETGKSYKWLMGRMLEGMGPRQGQALHGFRRVLAALWEELGNAPTHEKVPTTFVEESETTSEKVPTTFVEESVTTFVDGRPSPGFSGTGGTPNSPPRAAQTTGSPPPAPEKLGRRPRNLEEADAQKWLAPLDVSIAPAPQVRSTSDVSIAPAPQVRSTSDVSIAPAPQVRSTSDVSSAPARQVGTTSDDSSVPARQVGTTSDDSSAPARHARTTSDQKEPDPKVPTTFRHVPDPHELRSEAEFFGAGGGAPLFEPAQRASLGGTTGAQKSGSGRGSNDESKVPVNRGPFAQPMPPARATKPTPHVDPDEVYLDTSGLVLLWPFLATFFDRLQLLLENRTFRSPAARCRAVYLLQHLATTDLEPPEYRLPLAKVLCGMPLDDLLNTDPELTPIETIECDDVLAAILAHAKNLGEITAQDFRDGFLLRRGILRTRDDSWLLRVERAPYDLALDRLPWSLRWIRLPWMDAPIAVEWLR